MFEVAEKCLPWSTFTHTLIAYVSEVPVASKPSDLEAFWVVKALGFIF